VYDLQDKSIIITGGASGIGRAAAALAAQVGARVTIGDLDEEMGSELVRELQASGSDAQFVRTDVADERQVRALVDAAVGRFGHLDGAFNNAGIPPVAVPMAEITADQFRRMLAVNLTGVFLCMRYEILAMLGHRGGSIVNTSSSAAAAMLANMADYGAAKYGVVGLTKAGAIDYADRGIRINVLLPGAIRTQMFSRAAAANPGLEKQLVSMQPIGRLGKSEEVAAAAIFLLSDAASLITGASLAVDGGCTI